jgi:serine protease Do
MNKRGRVVCIVDDDASLHRSLKNLLMTLHVLSSSETPASAVNADMRKALIPLLVISLLAWLTDGAEAQSVADVFRKVNSSVVLIRARGRDVSASAGGLVRFNEIGSGVIISADGQVMTAAHVVNAMDEITVEILGGPAVRARVLSSEPAADLALLKLDAVPPSWAPAPMADTDSVVVGDQVIVIGAPYGLTHSLSVGWISARWAPNTVYGAMPLAEFFQTTATINTGNSGGPMFNMAGEIVGIVSHNISKSGGSEGLGFVVTMNTARMLLLQERSFWSGLSGQIVSGDLAVILNLPQPTGYLVKTVAKDSLGWHMGLQGGDKVATIDGQQVAVGGDIILAVEGMPVGKAEDHARIRDVLIRKPPGAPFTMKVLRGGKILELTGTTP